MPFEWCDFYALYLCLYLVPFPGCHHLFIKIYLGHVTLSNMRRIVLDFFDQIWNFYLCSFLSKDRKGPQNLEKGHVTHHAFCRGICHPLAGTCYYIITLCTKFEYFSFTRSKDRGNLGWRNASLELFALLPFDRKEYNFLFTFRLDFQQGLWHQRNDFLYSVECLSLCLNCDGCVVI